jgi:FKBP-type peptidyl-prolyl cis-trans isomerase 2
MFDRWHSHCSWEDVAHFTREEAGAGVVSELTKKWRFIMSHRPLLLFAAVVISLGMIPATYGLQSQPQRDPSTEPSIHKMDIESDQAGSDQIVEGSKVTLQYVATAPCSTWIDYGNVTEFVQGRHEIIPAMEREVVGMKPGEEKQVTLSPEEAFGPHDERKTLKIPKTLLPFGTKAGDVLRNDAGELATVAEITDTLAVLDYNHPLAGKPLVVQLKILKVENPDQ